MNLHFLYPSAAYYLLGLPLLLLPYLLLRRRKTVVVPALFLYRNIQLKARPRFFDQLRLPPVFLLQLLILLILIFISSEPVYLSQRPQSIAIVIDNSASMQARQTGTVESSFELAKREARLRISQLPRKSKADIFTTSTLGNYPDPRLETKAIGLSPSESEKYLGTIEVSDAPDPDDTTLSQFFVRLLAKGFSQVVFFTDRTLSTTEFRPLNSTTEFVTVGAHFKNASIYRFDLYRSPFFPDTVMASVETWQEPGVEPKQYGIRGIVVENAETGKRLALENASQPNQEAFIFRNLEFANSYKASIVFNGEAIHTDGLDLDNSAYATLPDLKEVRLLLVSSDARVGSSLGDLPNVSVTTIAPEAYDPADHDYLSRFLCILFHRSMPNVMPPLPAAFLLPPDGNRLFELGAVGENPTVTDWVDGHSITAYLDFSLLSPKFAQSVLPRLDLTPTISSTLGPLVLSGRYNGNRYAVTGFDILPYLGANNLPTSILTLNVLAWLTQDFVQSEQYPTGTVLVSTAATMPDMPTLFRHTRLAATDQDEAFDTEGYETLRNDQGEFLLNHQGIYTLRDSHGMRRLAANLLDKGEQVWGKPFVPQHTLLETMNQEGTIDAHTLNEQPYNSLWTWLIFFSIVAWFFDGAWRLRHDTSQAVNYV